MPTDVPSAARAGLPDRVDRRVPDIARRMVADFAGAIPAYRALPREELEGEITRICVANLRLLLACLREGRVPDDDELAEPRASATRRAEERIPLDQVLTAYLRGAQLGWEALVEEATPAEADELRDAVTTLLGYIGAVVGVVSQAYVEEQQALVGDERDARRQLTEALLRTGDAPAALAERAGVRPVERYRAVALRFAATADESDPTVSTAVAGRRKVRRAVDAIERVTGGPALTLLDAAGGAAVLDLPDPEAARAAIEAAIDADVWLAVSDPVRLPALPRAWQQAVEVRRVVGLLDRPAGVWTVEDVLLERTLLADPDAARRLAAVLEPLEERDDLMATLEVWFDVDFDRREAAQRLTIHPNTLDYRLRRVSELIGRDLATAHGTQLLGAALLARKLRS